MLKKIWSPVVWKGGYLLSSKWSQS